MPLTISNSFVNFQNHKNYHPNNTKSKIQPHQAHQVQQNQVSFEGAVSVAHIIPGAKFSQIVEQYSKVATGVVEDFAARANKEGQFLSWIDLPKNQLSRVNEIYDTVAQFKKINGEKPLAVIGIGGSKHPLEALLNLFNLGRKVKEKEPRVHFYSDIDPISFARFKEGLGGKFSNANYFIVSKSGTTFEPKDAYLRVEKELIKEYVQGGYSPSKASEKVNQQFAIATDANPNSSELRRRGIEKGYMNNLVIHDDVGGRFSAFDDPGLFTLAYAGLAKSDMIKMLNSAAEMSKSVLKPDLTKNQAIRRAIFNSIPNSEGKQAFAVHQYFGSPFEGGMENWSKQLYLESLKDFNYGVGKAPDSMHYATEGHFDRRNEFNTTLTRMIIPNAKNNSGYLRGVELSYKQKSPTSVEKLKTDGLRIAPETVGEYLQMKHAETVMSGMLRRAIKGESQPETLPEVLQPSVEFYKKNLKGRLTPGE